MLGRSGPPAPYAPMLLGVAVGFVAAFVVWVEPSTPTVGAAVLAATLVVGLTARPSFRVDSDELLDMVELPGGSFVREDGRTISVSAFAIGKFTVTRRLYREFVGRGPGAWTGRGDLPATGVSWLDAVSFCNALSAKAGLTAAYRIDGERVDPVPGASGYRLPTEAEWEYACRGGTTTAWSFGDDERLLGDYAWFLGNSKGRVHPVGQKRPNPFGLHDMHGNVWEWCQDTYGGYDTGVTRDPQGAVDGSARVLRGGSAWYVPRDLRSALRFRNEPTIRGRDIGFRCVRAPRRQP